MTSIAQTGARERYAQQPRSSWGEVPLTPLSVVLLELEKICGKFHKFSDEEITELLPKKNKNTRKNTTQRMKLLFEEYLLYRLDTPLYPKFV